MIFINRKNDINSGVEKMPEVFTENGKNRKYKDYLKRHTAVEISLIKKGIGKCITESESYPLNDGDIFIFAPNEMHVFEIITIHTEPYIIWSIGPEFPDSELLKIFFDKNSKFKNRILKNEQITPELTRLIEDIFLEMQKK